MTKPNGAKRWRTGTKVPFTLYRDGEFAGSVRDAAHALELVTAANHHDALVEALELCGHAIAGHAVPSEARAAAQAVLEAVRKGTDTEWGLAVNRGMTKSEDSL
jgi:hypothetical protein